VGRPERPSLSLYSRCANCVQHYLVIQYAPHPLLPWDRKVSVPRGVCICSCRKAWPKNPIQIWRLRWDKGLVEVAFLPKIIGARVAASSLQYPCRLKKPLPRRWRPVKVHRPILLLIHIRQMLQRKQGRMFYREIRFFKRLNKVLERFRLFLEHNQSVPRCPFSSDELDQDWIKKKNLRYLSLPLAYY